MVRFVFVLAVLLNFYFFESTAQSFQKTINNNIKYIDATQDGGVIAIDNSASKIQVIKLDASGEITWAKNLEFTLQNIFTNVVKQTSTGDYLIGGYVILQNSEYSPFLVKTNASGQITFAKTYGSDPIIINAVTDIEETVDNGYILSTTAGFIKTDNDGILSWAKAIDVSGFNAVEVLTDGYLFAGYYTTTDKDAFVCKTDLNGDVVWASTYEGSGSEQINSMTATSNNKYIFTGKSEGATTSQFILKIENDGSLLLSKEIKHVGKIKALYNIVESSDNNYVISANTTSGIDLLYKISTTGTLLWGKNFGPSGTNSTIVKNSSTGFIIQKSNDQIAKTDDQGNGICTRLSETATISDFTLNEQSVTVTSADITIVPNDLTSTTSNLNATSDDEDPTVAVNAGNDFPSCKGQSAQLYGTVTGPYLNAYWQGGSDNFTPDSSSLTAKYQPSTTEINNKQIVTLALYVTGASCGAVSDEINISIEGDPTVANAGTDIGICNSTATLNGNTPTSGKGIWSFVSGNGSLSNAISPQSNVSSLSGFPVQLKWTISNTCGSKADIVSISLAPPVIVNAGTDLISCTNDTVRLNGSTATGATSYSWTGGTGTFKNANSLHAKYVPSTAEITNGLTQLTLKATGPCQSNSDNIKITIDQLPSTLVPSDKNVCGKQTASPLIFNLADGSDGDGFWTGGNGTFTPDRNTVTTSYAPTDAEVSAGKALLTWNLPSALGVCPANSEVTKIIYNMQPTVSAGANLSTCAQDVVTLNGSATNSSSYAWTGGTGTYTPSANVLNPVYKPATSEIGTNVTLTLKAIPYPGCADKYSSTTLSVDGNPSSVTTNADPSICADAFANLQGIVNGTGFNSTYSWTGGTGTFTPNRNSLSATYTPSTSEINAGTVALTFQQASLNNVCPAKKSIANIAIKKLPKGDAGDDMTICSTATAQLNAAVTVVVWGTWSGGNGTFSPSATEKNAVYTPTSDEITAGSATLTFTPNSNGCSVSSDDMTITFDVCNGIFDNKVSENIHIKPNPSSGNVYISYEGNLTSETDLKVLSTDGRVVFENNAIDFSNELMIDLSELPSGIYMLQLISGNKVEVKMLVRE